MQQTITDADIHDFLDKLALFVQDLGEYEYYSTNEHFQVLIKTKEHAIRVSLEGIISNREKQLTQEHYQKIANSLKQPNPKKTVVEPAPVVQKRIPKKSRQSEFLLPR